MEPISWETVITALVAVIGALGLERLIPYLIERRARRRQAEGEAARTEAEAGKIQAETGKIQAETKEKTLDGAFRLIEVLTGQIRLLEERVNGQARDIARMGRVVQRYAARIEYLMRGIRVLLEQIELQKIAPCWQPDEWSPEEEEESA